MHKTVCLALVAVGLAAMSCPSNRVYVLTAQVYRSIEPVGAAAVVILGQASIAEPEFPRTPDPGDTSFAVWEFPAWLTPVSGAKVLVNGDTLFERKPGIYFGLVAPPAFEQPCELMIDVNGQDPIITGKTVLADSFVITEPALAESLHRPVRITWQHSDSAQQYAVNIATLDTASQVKTHTKPVSDTTYTVPVEVFNDPQGTFQPGLYVAQIWAVNGGWKRDVGFVLSGGNIRNAVGIFGSATLSAPVPFLVLPD